MKLATAALVALLGGCVAIEVQRRPEEEGSTTDVNSGSTGSPTSGYGTTSAGEDTAQNTATGGSGSTGDAPEEAPSRSGKRRPRASDVSRPSR